MKKAMFILLAVVVLVFASVATASARSWNPVGPTYAADAAIPGSAPHSGYATTTDKCEVCHSPHQAGNGTTSWKLTRGADLATACDYCHDGTTGVAGATYRVYRTAGDLVPANGHQIGTAITGGIPDSNLAAASWTTLGCFDCHTVHGANKVVAAITSANGLTGAQLPGNAILKNDPGRNGGTATTVTGFCADCHDMNLNQTANNNAGYTHLAPTHVMVDQGGLFTHANAGSTSYNCINCHTATGQDTTNSWPHDSSGAALMNMKDATTAYVTQSTMDANCLTCHSTGVGSTY